MIARDDLTMASAGLALAEAHEVLSGIQHHLVTAQAVTAAAAGRDCASCGGARGRKDTRHIVLRTLFGTLRLESPRYKACPCAPGGPATVSPLAALLPERTTPELLLQEAKYAALTSYGAAATLLSEAFPLGRTLQPTAVRQQARAAAWSRSSRCGGRPAVPTFFCRSAPASSMTTSPATSPAGTPDSPPRISGN